MLFMAFMFMLYTCLLKNGSDELMLWNFTCKSALNKASYIFTLGVLINMAPSIWLLSITVSVTQLLWEPTEKQTMTQSVSGPGLWGLITRWYLLAIIHLPLMTVGQGSVSNQAHCR